MARSGYLPDIFLGDCVRRRQGFGNRGVLETVADRYNVSPLVVRHQYEIPRSCRTAQSAGNPGGSSVRLAASAGEARRERAERDEATRAFRKIGSAAHLGIVIFAGQARMTRPRPLPSRRVTPRLTPSPGRTPSHPAPRAPLCTRSAALPGPHFLSVLTTSSAFLSVLTRQIISKRTRKWSELIGR